MSALDMNSRGKKWTAFQSAFIAIIVGIVTFITFNGYREPKITVSPENLKVLTGYKITVPINEITNADTLSWNDMPTIVFRSNGISLLGVNRGYFKTKDGNTVWLNVKSGISPVIRITDKNEKVYYLNRKNPDETRNIFSSLTNYLKNEK